MPRSGDGTWYDIPNITAVAGQIIESADWNNYRADLRDNEFNAPRPITAGGTGATNAIDALNNLGGVGAANFLDSFSAGDFFDTVRTLDDSWLKRDGKLYLRADYPDLAAVLPELPDGVIWNTANSGTINTISSIKFGNGKFVATAGSSDILVSTDRISWFPRVSGTSQSIKGMLFGAGVFVIPASGGVIVKSSDTITWGEQTIISGGILNGGVYNGTTFVVVGGLSGNPRAAYSTDAATWTVNTPPGTGTYLCAASNGSRTVIVGTGGKVVTSDDNGATWSSLFTTGISSPQDVTWDADRSIYIVVGGTGAIATSTDGQNWTARSSGTSAQLNAVDASSTGIMAVGANGTVVISSNGTSYSSVASGFTADLNGVTHDDANPALYTAGGVGGLIANGTRTDPTQFRVPNDDPVYGWIKAEDA